MCCERLVCAQCAGLVIDAGCATCHTARSAVHRASAPQMPYWLVALAVLLITLSVLVATYR